MSLGCWQGLAMMHYAKMAEKPALFGLENFQAFLRTVFEYSAGQCSDFFPTMSAQKLGLGSMSRNYEQSWLYMRMNCLIIRLFTKGMHLPSEFFITGVFWKWMKSCQGSCWWESSEAGLQVNPLSQGQALSKAPVCKTQTQHWEAAKFSEMDENNCV